MVGVLVAIEKKIFSKLVVDGGEYESLDDLRSALVQELMNYSKELPVEYDPMDMLIWGRRNGWVFSENGTSFSIRVPQKA